MTGNYYSPPSLGIIQQLLVSPSEDMTDNWHSLPIARFYWFVSPSELRYDGQNWHSPPMARLYQGSVSSSPSEEVRSKWVNCITSEFGPQLKDYQCLGTRVRVGTREGTLLSLVQIFHFPTVSPFFPFLFYFFLFLWVLTRERARRAWDPNYDKQTNEVCDKVFPTF